jgi:hypothetical protein
MIIKLTKTAAADERFADNAFHSQIGGRIPVDIEGHETATLVFVKVAKDGSSVELGVVLDGDEAMIGKW